MVMHVYRQIKLGDTIYDLCRQTLYSINGLHAHHDAISPSAAAVGLFIYGLIYTAYI